MDALVIGTALALGLLLIFDAFTRPDAGPPPLAWLRLLGPRALWACVGALVALLVTGWPVVALAGALLGAAIPRALQAQRDSRTSVARMEGIVEVAGRLRDAIRSGIGLTEALAHAAANPPPAIASDLKRLASDARVGGLSEAAAAFATRMRDPAAELLCSALALADRQGSRNLSSVLDALAEATASHAATVREARARQTRARMSARIVAGVPLLLLIGIRRVNPTYLAPFVTSDGQIVLGIVLALIWVGYRATKRAGRLEGETP